MKTKIIVIMSTLFLIAILLYFVGFDIAGEAGVAILLFFGIGSLVAGVTGLFKPAGIRDLRKSILLIIYGPFFVWFGYSMVASGFYTPMYAFLNDPTKIISNPGSTPIVGFMGLSMGFATLYIIFNSKPEYKPRKNMLPILLISSLVFIILGGNALFSNFFEPTQFSNNTIVEYKTIAQGGLGRTAIQIYRLRLNVNGKDEEFDVSKQIYSIFDVNDKVSISYKGGSLETITLKQ